MPDVDGVAGSRRRSGLRQDLKRYRPEFGHVRSPVPVHDFHGESARGILFVERPEFRLAVTDYSEEVVVTVAPATECLPSVLRSERPREEPGPATSSGAIASNRAATVFRGMSSTLTSEPCHQPLDEPRSIAETRAS